MQGTAVKAEGGCVPRDPDVKDLVGWFPGLSLPPHLTLSPIPSTLFLHLDSDKHRQTSVFTQAPCLGYPVISGFPSEERSMLQ